MSWYRRATSESMEFRYGPLIDSFIEINISDIKRMLSDSEWSKGECDSVARDLADYLSEFGVSADVISCTGLKPPLPDDAHPDWRGFASSLEMQKYLWHAVVRVPEGIIDLTGSQYGSSFGGVRYLTFDELKKEWNSFKTHPADYRSGFQDIPSEDLS